MQLKFSMSTLQSKVDVEEYLDFIIRRLLNMKFTYKALVAFFVIPVAFSHNSSFAMGEGLVTRLHKLATSSDVTSRDLENFWNSAAGELSQKSSEFKKVVEHIYSTYLNQQKQVEEAAGKAYGESMRKHIVEAEKAHEEKCKAEAWDDLIKSIQEELQEGNKTSWSQYIVQGAWNHKGKILLTTAGATGLAYAYKKGYLTKENLQALQGNVVDYSTQLYNSAKNAVTKENMQNVYSQAKDKAKAGWENTKEAFGNAKNWVGSWFKKPTVIEVPELDALIAQDLSEPARLI
jgi:hypothetical protein